MRITIISRLKILLYSFLLLLCVMQDQAISDLRRLLLTPNQVYKKILKLRTLPFEDCGSSYDMLYLSISSCGKIPCEIALKSKANVYVKFDDNGRNTNFLKHRVTWIFNAIRTNATITPDPCYGARECLLNSTDGKSYNSTLHVDKTLPPILGTILWEAEDESGNDVICFRVPVLIVK